MIPPSAVPDLTRVTNAHARRWRLTGNGVRHVSQVWHGVNPVLLLPLHLLDASSLPPVGSADSFERLQGAVHVHVCDGAAEYVSLC